MVLVLGKAICMLDFFGGSEIYEGYSQGVSPVEKVMLVLSKVLLMLQIGLLILLAYCGFRTGLNYNSYKNNKGN